MQTLARAAILCALLTFSQALPSHAMEGAPLREQQDVKGSSACETYTPSVTGELPPVFMHVMPWFQYDKKSGSAGWHWKMNVSDQDFKHDRRPAAWTQPALGPYDSADRAHISYQVDLWQKIGLHGIIVNWYGTRKANDFPVNLVSSNAIIKEASARGMLFTLCYEDWTVASGLTWGVQPSDALLQSAREQLKLDFEYMRDHYFHLPGSLTERHLVADADARPVIFIFGPRNLLEEWIWRAMLEEVFPDESTRPVLVTLYGAPAKFVGDAVFSWFPPMQTNPGPNDEAAVLQSTQNYLTGFMNKYAKTHRVVGSVFPGFRDYYKQGGAGDGYGILPAYGGKTLDTALSVMRANKPFLIQACTWNDFQEGTVFEPAWLHCEEREVSPYFRLKHLARAIRGIDLDDAELEALTERYRTANHAEASSTCSS